MERQQEEDNFPYSPYEVMKQLRQVINILMLQSQQVGTFCRDCHFELQAVPPQILIRKGLDPNSNRVKEFMYCELCGQLYENMDSIMSQVTPTKYICAKCKIEFKSYQSFVKHRSEAKAEAHYLS